jgi:hypothetical protein
MEINFTDSDLRFRDEVRAFLKDEYPSHVKSVLTLMITRLYEALRPPEGNWKDSACSVLRLSPTETCQVDAIKTTPMR